MTLTSFHTGVAVGYGSVKLLSVSGAFIGRIPLLTAFGLTCLAQPSGEKKVSADTIQSAAFRA